MIKFEIDAVVVNVITLLEHDLEQIDETEDGLVCCGHVESLEQLVALMADDYVEIKAVYVANKYKDKFQEFKSWASSDDGFYMDDEDNDINKVLEIILKT
ncbi:hypothetical protein [Jeotgalibaca porci]|uniref:hypothetical protein n=1 Tax=Jeotgalibaca porci TaxID=1868793 RepID=UPI0035A13D29